MLKFKYLQGYKFCWKWNIKYFNTWTRLYPTRVKGKVYKDSVQIKARTAKTRHNWMVLIPYVRQYLYKKHFLVRWLWLTNIFNEKKGLHILKIPFRRSKLIKVRQHWQNMVYKTLLVVIVHLWFESTRKSRLIEKSSFITWNLFRKNKPKYFLLKCSDHHALTVNSVRKLKIKTLKTGMHTFIIDIKQPKHISNEFKRGNICLLKDSPITMNDIEFLNRYWLRQYLMTCNGTLNGLKETLHFRNNLGWLSWSPWITSLYLKFEIRPPLCFRVFLKNSIYFCIYAP